MGPPGERRATQGAADPARRGESCSAEAASRGREAIRVAMQSSAGVMVLLSESIALLRQRHCVKLGP